MKSLISIAISIVALLVSLSSFFYSWWLNTISVAPNFHWYKSENDDSVKLTINLNNLSPRSTMLVSFDLTQNKRLVSDNGYDYESANDAARDQKFNDLQLVHENRIREIQRETRRDFPDLKDIHNPAILAEENRYRKQQEKEVFEPFHNLSALSFNKPTRKESHNFSSPTALNGNAGLSFSYWLDPNDLPNKLEIRTNRTFKNLRKHQSFVIPRIPDNLK